MVKSRPARHGPHSRPALKAGEYAVLIRVNVPDLAFLPPPISEAVLDVSVQKMVAPPVEVMNIEPPAETPPVVPLDRDPDYVAGRSEE